MLGIQAEIHGVNTPIRGGRFSAEAEGRTIAAQYVGGATAALDKAGLFGAARSGALERDWVRELAELNKKEGGKPGLTGSEPARRVAEILHGYQELARQNLNRAGAWIGDIDGWVAHTSHDPDRMFKAGYEPWREQATAGLDLDKTFADVGDGTGKDAAAEKFLRGVYNALVTGVHLTAEGGQGFKDPAFEGPGNLAKRVSQDRVLHWKDADAWLDYQKAFGQPNALRAVMGGLERAARDTALMRRWGTNPAAEFERDLQWAKEIRRNTDLAGVRRLNDKEQDLRTRFEALDGTSDRPANRLAAKIGSWVRLDESLAKLGGVAFTHLSAGVTKAAELRYHGVGLLQSYGDFLTSFVRGRGRSAEAREVMDRLHAGLEGMQRDLLGRFQPDDTVPGTASKLANAFFKLSGLTYLVNAQKAGAEWTMARHFGTELDQAHDALPAESRRTLNAYRITPAEWELLRTAPDHTAIGDRKFLTPDAAHRIPYADAVKHLNTTGALKGVPARLKGEPEPASVTGWRDDLALRVAAMYHDIADRAIVTPGVAEKALLTQGLRPGTVGGEALRFIAQFKQWPAAAIRQGLGREIYGGQGKLAAAAGIVHMAVGSTILGYLAMTLKDLTKGRTPRPPNDPKTWAAALMQGGGFGILGDFMFGEYNRFGQNPAETLAGPVLGAGFNTVLDLWNRLKDGKDLAPEAVRAVFDNTPFVNLFYTRTALNYLFLYQAQEALNPGFLRRYERTIRQNNNQSFIVPPSSRIPYGGGAKVLQGVRGQ